MQRKYYSNFSEDLHAYVGGGMCSTYLTNLLAITIHSLQSSLVEIIQILEIIGFGNFKVKDQGALRSTKCLEIYRWILMRFCMQIYTRLRNAGLNSGEDPDSLKVANTLCCVLYRHRHRYGCLSAFLVIDSCIYSLYLFTSFS